MAEVQCAYNYSLIEPRTGKFCLGTMVAVVPPVLAERAEGAVWDPYLVSIDTEPKSIDVTCSDGATRPGSLHQLWSRPELRLTPEGEVTSRVVDEFRRVAERLGVLASVNRRKPSLVRHSEALDSLFESRYQHTPTRLS